MCGSNVMHLSCCGDVGIFSADEPPVEDDPDLTKEEMDRLMCTRGDLSVRLGKLVEDKLGVDGAKARNGLGAKNNMIPCNEKVGCKQSLMWQTETTEVNGYKKILESLGADDNMVKSFDEFASDMLEDAKKMTVTSRDGNSGKLKGQLLGAKLQMSCDRREEEMVITRPRIDVGFDDLRDLHLDHETHVFRVLIPLDDFGVWQILYDRMLVGNTIVGDLQNEGTLPKEPHPSVMLYVAKQSYAIIPVEIIFAENFRTSINGNKHMEMYLMLTPEDKDYPVWKTDTPEYFCWGVLNTEEGTEGRDDRGMVVYPYNKVAERDRHIVVSLGLECVTQTFCLVQDVSVERIKDRDSRMNEWGFVNELSHQDTTSDKHKKQRLLIHGTNRNHEVIQWPDV